jgi:formylglycine-generating enzyme required for sulfatase activity
LNGGQGLANAGSAGTYEPGWVASDNGNIALTDAKLECDHAPNLANYDTWTPSPGNQENLPINCVNWYQAYAFCIWDGGFLPSDAEWEYAATGGSQQREYPWGTAAPGTANQYAIYGCNYPNGSASCPGVTSIAPVGTATLGAGLWGQLDLAGNMWEWALDWLDSTTTYVNPCSDCAYLTASTGRVFRGGSFGFPVLSPPAARNNYAPDASSSYTGIRCARAP